MRTPQHSIFRAASLVCVFLLSSFVHAHHDPGHGPSEAMKVLGMSGTNPAPRQRLSLLGQVTRSSDEPTLNVATTYGLVALASVRAWERVYFDGQLPLVLIDQDAASELISGLGDMRLGVTGAFGKPEKRDDPRFYAGLSASLPTRTFTYVSDPGRQWVVSPNGTYAQSHGRLSWYGFVAFPAEFRPAGVAWELSALVGGAWRFFPAWSVGLGANVDVRLASFCKEVDGSSFCSEGRATEANRPVGATRVYGTLSSTLRLSKRWFLLASAQLPFTERRDVEWFVNFGVEARF